MAPRLTPKACEKLIQLLESDTSRVKFESHYKQLYISRGVTFQVIICMFDETVKVDGVYFKIPWRYKRRVLTLAGRKRKQYIKKYLEVRLRTLEDLEI